MAFLNNCLFLVLSFQVLTCSSDININIANDDTLNTRNVKKTFSYLLNNLLNIQEHRLESIKKLAALDDVFKTTNPLRGEDLSSESSVSDQSQSDESVDDNTESDSDDGNASDEDVGDESDDNGLTVEANGLSQYLRSCGRRSCKRACRAATRYGCSYYRCRRSLKRAFKKECKRSCSGC